MLNAFFTPKGESIPWVLTKRVPQVPGQLIGSKKGVLLDTNQWESTTVVFAEIVEEKHSLLSELLK